jgi:hypothetical protein
MRILSKMRPMSCPGHGRISGALFSFTQARVSTSRSNAAESTSVGALTAAKMSSMSMIVLVLREDTSRHGKLDV